MTAADIDRAEERRRHQREYESAWQAVKEAETPAAVETAWQAMQAARTALGFGRARR